MIKQMIQTLPVLLAFLMLSFGIRAQDNSEAALLLDLKKTRADYEVAKQKYQNDTKLYNEKAISANDFNHSKNELLKDADSPHWYNPYEDYSTSKKPVAIDQIPQYQEQIASFSQRIEFISGYLVAMILTIAILFMACFYFFTRYDVR